MEFAGENQENKVLITCRRCPCKMMRPGAATLVNDETHDLRGRQVSTWWLLRDMYAFENIGFLRDTQEGIKFLICADCESEVVGFHDTKVKDKFYVAADMVEYKP